MTLSALPGMQRYVLEAIQSPGAVLTDIERADATIEASCIGKRRYVIGTLPNDGQCYAFQ